MSLRPVNPRWFAVSVACVVLMVIAVLLGDWLASGIAIGGAALTGYQAYVPPSGERPDDEG
jgi:hypothetical protein